MEIKLGKKYKETTHGIVGVATVHSKYLTGCDRICLERMGKDGNVIDRWVDISTLENFTPEPHDIKPGGPGKVAPPR